MDIKFCTVAGLRVTSLLRYAYTSPAAMFGLRIGACSDPSPTTTRFRASAEGGKAAMHRNYHECNSKCIGECRHDSVKSITKCTQMQQKVYE